MEAMVKTIPVYYEEYGTGIPILMLHGAQVDHSHMVADLEPLFQNHTSWRRIYPDLPGFGKTPGADWITGLDEFVDILTVFMVAIAPNQRFVVLGISMGGLLAQGLVYQQGAIIDGLLLLVPRVKEDLSKQQKPSQQILIEDSQFQSGWPPEESVLRNLAVIQSLELLEWYRTLVQPATEVADYNFLMKVKEQFSFPFDHLKTPFPGPTLILTGRQDSICGYNDAWSLLEDYPRGTFAVLDRAGHFLHIEQQALFQALMSEWLVRVKEYIAHTSA
jgi:pimeloyl-ACP methyl ester carboxylesterase